MPKQSPPPSAAATASSSSTKRQKVTAAKPTTKSTANKTATKPTSKQPTLSSASISDDISDFIYFKQPTDNQLFQTYAAANDEDDNDGMSDGEDGEYIEVEDKVKSASQLAKQQEQQSTQLQQPAAKADNKMAPPQPKQPVKPMFSIEDSASDDESSSEDDVEEEKTYDSTHIDTNGTEEMKVSFADVRQQSAAAAAPPTTQASALADLQQNTTTATNEPTSTTAITPFNTSASNPLRQPSQVSPAASNVMQARTRNNKQKLIIVLLKSSLATIKTKKGYELVSADLHHKILHKLNLGNAEYRPDITHQCLLTLLDSPLNKSGKLQVYIETNQNVLIEVNSKIRIPRTYKRFAGLMVQLLHKLKIRSSEGSDVLLKIIKNPITQYLPVNSIKLGTSVTGTLVDVRELANALPSDRDIVMTVGAHASGPADADWTDRSIAVSQYPLSASYAIGRVLNAFEYQWGCL